MNDKKKEIRLMKAATILMKSIVLTFLLFSSIVCCSQAYKYRFRTITLPEEFKNQYISTVDEDAAGMLWFVTTSGLHRYDGNQVLTFDMQSTPALPDVEIGSLVAGSHNCLWLVIRGQLVCFDLQRWTTRTIAMRRRSATGSGYSITTITEDQDGTIYAACSNMLYRVAQDSLEYVTQIERQSSDTAGRFFINRIYQPKADQLLLTTSNGEVASIHHRRTEFDRPCAVKQLGSARALDASAIVRPFDKYLINVTGSGACMVDLNRLVVVPLANLAKKYSLETSYYFISMICEFGRDQGILFHRYVGSAEIGLLIYNPENDTFEDLSKNCPAAIKNNQIRMTFYKNGHLMIPIKAGIATISRTNSPIDVFAASMENANSIRSLYKEAGGRLFIGSYLYGFIQFDEASTAIISHAGNFAYCLQRHSKDSILVGTEGAGLCWYLPAKNSFVYMFGKGTRKTIGSSVFCLTRENDSTFWAGTYTGLHLINPSTQRIIKTKQNKGPTPLHSLVIDVLKVGTTRFFATREGLFKYNMVEDTWEKMLTSNSADYAHANFSCLRLVNNQVWAGTVGNGMLVLDTAGNLLRKITTAEGLAGNIIFSNPLCKNHLFVGTRTGLSIIDLQSGKINNYSSEYYLPADEFNRSAWCVNGDTVYMGTVNGFIRIDVNRLKQPQTEAAPGVCFSSFTYVGGDSSQSNYNFPYRSDPSLLIPPDASNFSIGFGALSELAAGLKLYYRLNADGPWQEIGQRREVTFVNVAPDKYTMQIAARMPDGRWIENILSLPITVQPHFYQTWWWKGLLFAIGLGLIWLGIKYREKNILKEQKLRSRIAGDLHDEVGSALTRIYFQAGMLTTTEEKANALPTTALQQIASSSQEALSSMSDMVWSIDALYDTAPEMVGRMKDYIARLQDELGCNCTFNVSGNYNRLKLSQVMRQNILLIFKEAINNALKYGNNKTAEIRLSLNENLLILEVMNKLTNAGIPETTVQGGHGLKSMQLRADKIKAKLTVNQANDAFTVHLQAKPF